ncbi:MAG TPA: 16S rRNA (cytosine(967)-C(5))-methyltransferase RsmB [Oscillospiraceae bacterium]|nr:16S rRNA (cytosine(967)-C(5))-methyltransferase RsmB [Oscillospiraceae bacterium]
MKNARVAALTALLHVDVNEGYSNLVIDKTLKEFQLDPRDCALATAIFYGVLERRITLDSVISQFSKTPIKKMSPQVLEILRIGAYQILYMEKIPKSAAVNEAVNSAKSSGAVKASGFINGVLRALIRGLDTIAMPDEKKAPIAYLSVKYSCPQWLIMLWQQAYGIECTEGLLKSLADRPPIFARVNTTKIDTPQLIEQLASEGVKASTITWLPNAIMLEQTGSISQSKCFQEGLLHIQDLSSQLCCTLLNPQPKQRVIDVCSAPGGKTFTMAEMMKNTGELLAFDKYKGKVRLIRQGANRLGLSIIQAGVRDAENPQEDLALADCVLCDAPCSGLGIIRRKPEIRYKLESTLDTLPNLQYLILCKSAKLVKAGGILFYSTCSLNPKENAEVANRFLKEHNEFLPLSLQLPNPLSHAIEEEQNQLTLMPHVHGTDGFFMAAFRKK